MHSLQRKLPKQSEFLEREKMFNSKLYPNPANDEVIYTYSLQDKTVGSFQLKDVLSQTLLISNLLNGYSIIKTTGLSPGIYFYRIMFNEELKQEGWLSIIR
jgi:hypothetical protein